ncbi:MAG: universal stress protein [Burkholderiaceae bacterium]
MAEAQAETPTALARGDAGARRILLAVDGSEHSRKAIEQVLALSKDARDPRAMQIHLANVQPSLPGDVSGFVSKDSVHGFHHEHADAALKTARQMLQQAGLVFKEHEAVGHAGPMIAEMAKKEGCDLIVMGTRGLGSKSAALLGSVAQSTLEHATVPVLLVK